ncbi:hypothetical protein HT031_002276 [Scenedesmus sp. PABB004]|nr:hypothetical protein HT031_002276 [Scenedesmus sp. PABB004]
MLAPATALGTGCGAARHAARACPRPGAALARPGAPRCLRPAPASAAHAPRGAPARAGALGGRPGADRRPRHGVVAAAADDAEPGPFPFDEADYHRLEFVKEPYGPVAIDSANSQWRGVLLFQVAGQPGPAHEDTRVMEIFISGDACISIYTHLCPSDNTRPMALDILWQMWQRGRTISRRDWTLLRVAVVACVNDVYYGRLFFGDPETGAVHWDCDVRPSDATFLALKAKAPMYVKRTVWDACSAPLRNSSTWATVNYVEGQREAARRAGALEKRSASAAAGPAPDTLPAIRLLMREMEVAVREEDYAAAARLRDHPWMRLAEDINMHRSIGYYDQAHKLMGDLRRLIDAHESAVGRDYEARLTAQHAARERLDQLLRHQGPAGAGGAPQPPAAGEGWEYAAARVPRVSRGAGCNFEPSLLLERASMLRRLLLLLVAAAALAAKAEAAAAPGPCAACRAVGGLWLATPSAVRPLCRTSVQHGGRARVVDVYFPDDVAVGGNVTYEAYVYLHGVHAAEWFVADSPAWAALRRAWPLPLAGAAQVADLGVLAPGAPITAAPPPGRGADGCGGGGKAGGGNGVKQARTVLIVPQAAGTVERGQMWTTGWWPCVASVGLCADAGVDDVRFIATLLSSLAAGRLLPGLPLGAAKAHLVGYSNGGMLAQTLLCARPDVVGALASVTLLASTLGREFAAGRCARPLPRSLPLLWVHGTADATLPYGPGQSEGVAVLGAEAAVRLWAARMGCGPAAAAAPAAVHSDAAVGVECRSFCAAAARPPVVLCTVAGGSHLLLARPLPRGWAAGLARWAGGGFAGAPTLF